MQRIVITGKKLSTTKESNVDVPIGSNVLNGYRSITYSFTLAGLPSNYVSDPTKYRDSELKYVILKSGGKNLKGFSNDVETITRKKRQLVSSAEDPFQYDEEIVINDNQTGKFLVDGFNKKSPGKYDMFIDDIQIETLMAFRDKSSVSLPTTIKFNVIEPYSINGFIEALHVAAVASGYSSYVQASFLLKIEFQGIPDTDGTPDAVKIPNSTRYFPIGFTNLQVELTERGTKYACSAVPYNERSFGQSNIVKKSITMKGNKIKDILENFITSLNEQVKNTVNDSATNNTDTDLYKVEFVEWNKKWVVNPNSAIANSDILNLNEDNALYKFAKPNNGKNAYKKGSSPKEIVYNPSEISINFPENSSVHEIITAIIRDSTYVKNILKKIESGEKIIDSYGYMEYFSVRLEVENKKTFDVDAKRPYQIFKYIISPYKIHYTRIPLYSQVKIKEETFKKIILRQYDYIYMGNNVDVMNFKLNFDTLYFEALPMSLGLQNYPVARDTIKFEQKIQPSIKYPSKEELINDNNSAPTPPLKYVSNSSENDGSAIPFQNDPYSILAKSTHNAIINSKASMVTGEIEILGDPFYLITGGLGSYNPEEDQTNRGTVGEGEASRDFGEVNILINFKNPIDIDSLENGGGLYFSPDRASFSGIYTVTTVKHNFKNGSFTQTLDLLRKPGQILDQSTKEIKLENIVSTKQVSGSTPQAVNIKEIGFTQRLDSASIADLINRANPSIGIPSLPSNFSNSPGGLGGENKSVFNRTAGVLQTFNNLASNAGTIGQILPTDQFSETRLSLPELTKLTQPPSNSIALLSAAANVITGNIPSQRVLGSIASTVLTDTIGNALKKSNVGSGIGKGAEILINPVDGNVISNPTSFDLKFGNIEDPTKLLNGTVSNIKSAIQDLGDNAVSTLNNFGNNVSGAINNIGNKIETSLGTLSDPKALAAKLNLDSSKLSGLSNEFQSKLTNQLDKLTNELPKNLDLSRAFDKGLALDILPKNVIPNIPPTQPYKTASLPDVIVSAQKTLKGYVDKISSSADLKILADKKETFKKQISQVSNQLNIAGTNIKTSVNAVFNSKSSMQNPLDNLFNKLNDPNAEVYTGNDPIIRARLGLPPIQE